MGVLIALLIISIWGGHLFYSLNYVEVSFVSPWLYLHLLIQAYLYTGLFITAHDAMHGTISNSKIINKGIGILSTFLFAGMSYNRLIKNHFRHHKTPGEADDPDFNINSQNFFIWWFSFMIRYTTITQIIIMAIVFNLLKLFFVEINIWFFWVIPAFLGTLQLFYFGTYQPHRKPHTDDMKPHNARSQKLNHLWAMLSCYFFGYHHEHHESPRTPWWKLYKLKESNS
jgi:beta-carotene/zeaxanthin 4-ketolase